MGHPIPPLKKRAVYVFAFIGGLLFATIVFAAEMYIRHNFPDWAEIFILLRALPLLFFLGFLRILHIRTNIETWNEYAFMAAVSVADGVAFGLFVLLAGLIWLYITDDSPRF